jgi:hypothetical protein
VSEHDRSVIVLGFLLEHLKSLLIVRAHLGPGRFFAKKHENLIAFKVAVKSVLRPLEQELLETEANEQVRDAITLVFLASVLILALVDFTWGLEEVIEDASRQKQLLVTDEGKLAQRHQSDFALDLGGKHLERLLQVVGLEREGFAIGHVLLLRAAKLSVVDQNVEAHRL